MAIITYLSIITFNVNGENALTKGHRVSDFIFKRTYNILPTRDSLQGKRYIDKVSGWKKIFCANGNKGVRVAIFTSQKKTLNKVHKREKGII